MNNYITILFLCISGLLLGQDRPEINTYEDIDIDLRNGSSLRGIGKINLLGELVFRKSEDSEKKKMGYKEVESFVISNDTLTRRFDYKVLKENNRTGKIMALERIESGRLNLYKVIVHGNVNMGMTGHSMPTTTTFYYISEPGSDIAEHIKTNTYSRKFRKNASKYFKDCPKLVKKIQNKGFQRNAVEEIVQFYNYDCN